MRGFVLQILVLASISNLVYCFAGHRGYSFQECIGGVEAASCTEARYSLKTSTASVTVNAATTPRPAIRRPHRRDVDKLTATCDDDICSIWEVSSTVFTIITGPDYTPTITSSISLSAGNSSSNGTLQSSSPPFANSTTSNGEFTTTLPSGTVSSGSVITSMSTTTSKTADENQTAVSSNATTIFLGTGGSTGNPPPQSPGGLFTNSSSIADSSIPLGTVTPSAVSPTITHVPSGIGPGGSAVSSGLFPSSSKTPSGVIWSNSSSIHGTGPRASRTNSGTDPDPHRKTTVPQWAPWTKWTSSSEAISTETAEPSNSESTTSSDSESTFYATTYVYTFSGTSYTIPIPASYTFLYSSTDTKVASEASSKLSAGRSDTSLGSIRTATTGNSPASTFGPTIQARPTSKSVVQALTPADTSSGFPTTDPSSASLDTFSSCFTTTPTYQFDAPTPVPSPTLVCWGFSCNNSTCSDWLSSYAIASYAITTGAPYANATDTLLTGTLGTGAYPTGTFSNVAGPMSANSTNIMATLTRTVYPVPSSTLTQGWGPWIEWTSTLSTSTTTTSLNNTDGPATQTEESSPTTSQPSSMGRVVLPLNYDDQDMRMGTPMYLREMLQRRSIELKRAQIGAMEDEENASDVSAVRKMRGIFG